MNLTGKQPNAGNNRKRIQVLCFKKYLESVNRSLSKAENIAYAEERLVGREEKDELVIRESNSVFNFAEQPLVYRNNSCTK